VVSDHAPINPGDTGDGPTRRVDSNDSPTRRVDPDDSLTVRELSAAARVFGRYVLESLAGRGGMGVVWKARDERLNRLVALKLLPEVVAGDPEAVKDLLRETNRCLELTHPHIVRVYDLVQDGPLAAISMEYVDGESLAKRKAAAPGGCLTLEELRPLTEQLCTALDYAHRVAKVVHRDLKPANLLLTRDGQLKVTDFGIARSLSDTHTRLTGRVSNTSGTLLYMSPQQLRGKILRRATTSMLSAPRFTNCSPASRPSTRGMSPGRSAKQSRSR
jgi:serine/threonine protein kinase